MRGKIVIAVVAVACLVAAGLYLSPTTMSKFSRYYQRGRPRRRTRPPPEMPPFGLHSVRHRFDGRFPDPALRHRFVSSRVVSINARVSSQIVSIAVGMGRW